MSILLIYGATGYTGRMAAERAKALGLRFESPGAITRVWRHSLRIWTCRFGYSMPIRMQRARCPVSLSCSISLAPLRTPQSR